MHTTAKNERNQWTMHRFCSCNQFIIFWFLSSHTNFQIKCLFLWAWVVGMWAHSNNLCRCTNFGQIYKIHFDSKFLLRDFSALVCSVHGGAAISSRWSRINPVESMVGNCVDCMSLLVDRRHWLLSRKHIVSNCQLLGVERCQCYTICLQEKRDG